MFVSSKYKYLECILIVFLLSIILINFIILLHKHYSKSNEKELFIPIRQNMDSQKTFEDGELSFYYLTDPNYKNNILNTYYMNDDIKINGNRLIKHPLQNINLGFNNGKIGYYYGSLPNNIDFSNNIYNAYKIRL